MVAVSVQLVGGTADNRPRARWKHVRRAIIPVSAALAAVGAFLAWGPVGVGPGPIGNRVSGMGSAGVVSQTQPAVFLVPIDAGRSGAVIDGIDVLSDGSYPAPQVISIKGDRQQACDGGPWPVTGRQNFYRACAAGGLVPLLGRAVPRSRVDVPGLGPATYPGIGAAIKAAHPGPAGCWMVTSIVIHYYVGIRHNTATYGISVTACSSTSQLAAEEQQ
jgi:hypothetical protein